MDTIIELRWKLASILLILVISSILIYVLFENGDKIDGNNKKTEIPQYEAVWRGIYNPQDTIEISQIK